MVPSISKMCFKSNPAFFLSNSILPNPNTNPHNNLFLVKFYFIQAQSHPSTPVKKTPCILHPCLFQVVLYSYAVGFVYLFFLVAGPLYLNLNICMSVLYISLYLYICIYICISVYLYLYIDISVYLYYIAVYLYLYNLDVYSIQWHFHISPLSFIFINIDSYIQA